MGARRGTRTTVITNYLEFWKQAPALYHALYSTLLEQQMGYLGMLFREAVANLEFYLDKNKQHHYFIGFNALSKAEAFLIQEILDAKRESVFGILIEHCTKIPNTRPGNSFVVILKIETPKTPKSPTIA